MLGGEVEVVAAAKAPLPVPRATFDFLATALLESYRAVLRIYVHQLFELP
jgi:hypothetical protein